VETLAYLHLVLTYENSQDDPETALIFECSGPDPHRGRGRTRSQYSLLALGTLLGLLGTTSNAFALLQHGDRNPQVTRVQKRLQELEFFKEEPTGYYGEVTVDAVKKFQRDRQIEADGIVGSETETALFDKQTARSDAPFNTNSFLATPESQTSQPSPPPQISSPGNPGSSNTAQTEKTPSSPSVAESTLAAEEESILRELLEPAPETAEQKKQHDSEKEAPGALAERIAARSELLKLGARGESVKQLQKKLQESGFAPGEIDGIYGQQTQKAVIAFQRSRGLFVDGIAGQQTLSTLKISASEPPQRLYTVKVRNS
jgi:peptidoglycan hydrolase-like protein with peptidoglycan-binding domain